MIKVSDSKIWEIVISVALFLISGLFGWETYLTMQSFGTEKKLEVHIVKYETETKNITELLENLSKNQDRLYDKIDGLERFLRK